MYKTITNAKIVTPERILHGDIEIDPDGKIKSLGVNVKHPGGVVAGHVGNSQIFDAQGKYVLPGLIEIHGHMREPGLQQKEDVPHGTRAAIAGGFTTIIDMPNGKPSTTTVQLLKQKINELYPGRSYTDYAFLFGVSKDSMEELEKVDKKDIVGFKVFMAGHETTLAVVSDDDALSKVFTIATKRNVLLAVHAEDQSLIDKFNKELKESGQNDPQLWSKARPTEVVAKAVVRAISLARQYKTRLYLLHLSTPEEFSLVQSAKKEGIEVFGELVSYQLSFNTNDYEQLGNKIKVAPAIRSPQDQDALWNLFKEQIPDVVCSEHTPHELETKNQDNVWLAQSGMPSIQETLPAIITGWVKRFGKENIEEGLKTIAKLSSKNPAKIFGFDYKGELKVGKDADCIVVDIENSWTVKKEDLFTKCGWSAYEGMDLIGRPTATFLRGELVYKEGEIQGDPRGSFLTS